MPKQFVTAIGLVLALGVVALGVFLVALPLYFAAVGVDTQTATVANSNAIYQTQVDNLREQEENLDTINADVDELRSQIPATGQLDDVFEVVAQASATAGVSLTSVTAGEQVVFTVRTAPTDGDVVTPVPVPEPAPTEGADGSDAATDTATTTDAAGAAPETATTGRQQVDFVINATAADMAQATAFLDELRRGPRLLNSVSAIANQSGEGTIDLQISAMTYLDSEG
ncbi:hypothetical protein [Microbacterium sp. CFBP9034]|uniref:hypothetical protein n=1 Tax=Microbacterium sp. CFBP9034 TaxID=3096540 RepID=UPI002A6A24D7|nr:hypothetical protein [Microbacterium sp. CFBP9034]MDY0910037.1 hypothetical protein [Microbacterium sp. CFBP9034]